MAAMGDRTIGEMMAGGFDHCRRGVDTPNNASAVLEPLRKLSGKDTIYMQPSLVPSSLKH